MLVTTFKRGLYRVKTVSNKEEAMGYIGDLASKLMTVLDEFRGVILLFNRLDPYNVKPLIFLAN